MEMQTQVAKTYTMKLIKENKIVILKTLAEKLSNITGKKIALRENSNVLGEDITSIEAVYRLVDNTLRNSSTRLSLDRIDENLARNNVSLKGEIDFNEYSHLVNKFSENGFSKSCPIEIGGNTYDNYISRDDAFTITIPKSKA